MTTGANHPILLGQGWLRGALAALLLLISGSAWACPICLSGVAVTPGQLLVAADQVVLAAPESDAKRYRIVEVIKGHGAKGTTIAQEVPGLDMPAALKGKAFVLLHDALAGRWSSIGAIGIGYAAWLRQLATVDDAGPTPSVFGRLRVAQTSAGQRQRAALVLPYLEDAEPLAAKIAYGEISRAPYAVLRTLKPRLDAAKIARWIEDPGLAARRSAYLLLLGIAGGTNDAVRLEQRIGAASQVRSDDDLAAMLAAVLELRGPSLVSWIEQAYVTDRQRTLPEIRAALLALGVHGNADAAVPRARVIEAYRLFIRERKPMAGFVALQLADWQHWDATDEYIALLQSDAIKDPGSRLAIVNYLQRSPHAAARATLQRDADTLR